MTDVSLMRSLVTHIVIVAVVSTAAPMGVLAQQVTPQPFTGMRVRPGDDVRVTLPDKARIEGALVRIDRTMIEVNGEWIDAASDITVERFGDSPWDGAVAGVVFGAAAGLLFGAFSGCPRVWQCGLGGAVDGLGIGVLVDFAHRGRTRVYPYGTSQPTAAPPTSRTSAQLRIAF